jgi:hypothetical protein
VTQSGVGTARLPFNPAEESVPLAGLGLSERGGGVPWAFSFRCAPPVTAC